MTTLRAHTVTSIAKIPAADWDLCAGDDNPFVSHAFLLALEQSGSANPATGWQPIHMVVEDFEQRIVGVAPAYVKSHSYGEYVFDHAWAQALERVGQRYYPKVQVCVPFTPVTGARLLVRPLPEGETRQVHSSQVRLGLGQALMGLLNRFPLSSLHMTFATPQDGHVMQSDECERCIERLDIQFHWHNQGYTCFDDFLSALLSRKRKAVIKEREVALSQGLSIRHITGADITEADMDHFYAFYLATTDNKWGQAYLTREFFSLIRESMSEKILLIFAEKNGVPIAGALNFIGKDVLYGRNWGCVEEHPFLHFEVCYYQAIDYAISKGFTRIEAGAQGAHKIARGYEPTFTRSYHYISHEGLRSAVNQFVLREREAITAHHRELSQKTPFKNKAVLQDSEQEDLQKSTQDSQDEQGL